MTDIIERLEHAAYAWEYGLTVCGDYMPSPAMMREAKLEIEALRKDAARWRFWRNFWPALCRMEVARFVGLDLTATYVQSAACMDRVTDAAMEKP